jgi:hypothetical protein
LRRELTLLTGLKVENTSFVLNSQTARDRTVKDLIREEASQAKPWIGVFVWLQL